MDNYAKFRAICPTAYADALPRAQFMELGLKALWQPIPRIAGPAFTVKCAPGDNLMLHAAIYRAQPGSILVVEAGNVDYAMSGGNVCAIAQKRGIAGFIIDGAIRDLAEVREASFPVFARGVIPKPGVKEALGTLQQSIHCGGVKVDEGDIIVADEEGIAVIPQGQQESVYQIALERSRRDAATNLEQWEQNHRTKIERILQELGFTEP